MKFFGYLVEEARSLPLMCDYQTQITLKSMAHFKQYFKQYADVNSSMMYAYCHKSLLPMPFNIVEEQTRARKWISDLHTKKSQANGSSSASNIAGGNSSNAAGSQFLQTNMKHSHSNPNNVLMNSTNEYANSYGKSLLFSFGKNIKIFFLFSMRNFQLFLDRSWQRCVIEFHSITIT